MLQNEKIHIENIGGETVKSDHRYVVKDNKTLNNLVVSSTRLKRHQSTTGHAHVGQEEVYYFVKGSGWIELIDTNGKDHNQNIYEGDVVLIPDGWFHRVHAGPYGTYFVCVFDGRREH